MVGMGVGVALKLAQWSEQRLWSVWQWALYRSKLVADDSVLDQRLAECVALVCVCERLLVTHAGQAGDLMGCWTGGRGVEGGDVGACGARGKGLEGAGVLTRLLGKSHERYVPLCP
jgi:hypothetical protein